MSNLAYKFAENIKVSAVHISDLTALYGRIIEKILQKETTPNGTEGYYFALAHDLICGFEDTIWPDDEVAAEALRVPIQFVQLLWNSGKNIISENKHTLGWKSAWNKDRFLKSIDDEIQAVLDLGKAKSSLIDSLFESARG